MKIKRFNENIDPYNEEKWDDKPSIYKIFERDIDEIGYVLAQSEAEAKERALDLGLYKEKNKRYVYAEEIERGPYQEMFSERYEERYELELERAKERYNLSKQILDSLNHCIRKIKELE